MRDRFAMCAPFCALLLTACPSPAATPDAEDRCADVLPSETLATEPGALPLGIAVDADFVYWADFHGHSIHRLAKRGAASVEVIATDEAPEYLAVDDLYVYWITGVGDVKRCPRSGGSVETLATAPGCGTMYPCAMALTIDDQAIYWAEKGTPGTIFRLPKSGGSAAALETAGLMTENIAVDGQYIYYGALSVDSVLRQVVRRIPTLGGPVETVAVFDDSLSDTAAYIAIASTQVYVARDSGVWKAAKDGSDTRLLTALSMPRQIIVDSAAIYVSRASSIEEIRLDNEGLTAVGCNQRSARALVADETRVYWVDESAETINAAQKR